MMIVGFIQDEHSFKEIMETEGLPDFRAPPAIPKFIDTLPCTLDSNCVLNLPERRHPGKHRI